MEKSLTLLCDSPEMGVQAPSAGGRTDAMPETGHSFDHRLVRDQIRVQRWYRQWQKPVVTVRKLCMRPCFALQTQRDAIRAIALSPPGYRHQPARTRGCVASAEGHGVGTGVGRYSGTGCCLNSAAITLTGLCQRRSLGGQMGATSSQSHSSHGPHSHPAT